GVRGGGVGEACLGGGGEGGGAAGGTVRGADRTARHTVVSERESEHAGGVARGPGGRAGRSGDTQARDPQRARRQRLPCDGPRTPAAGPALSLRGELVCVFERAGVLRGARGPCGGAGDERDAAAEAGVGAAVVGGGAGSGAAPAGRGAGGRLGVGAAAVEPGHGGYGEQIGRAHV